jgi:hypothetical protein
MTLSRENGGPSSEARGISNRLSRSWALAFAWHTLARVLLKLSCLALVLTEGVSWADDSSCPARAAAAARQAYQSVDFVGAAKAADVVACRDGSPAELAEALRWRAQAFAAHSDVLEAIQAFAQLAAVAPDYALDPFLSPKVHELFQAGRAEALLRHTVFLRLLAPAMRGGRTYARAEVYGPASPEVVFRFNVGEDLVDVPAAGSGHLYEAGAPASAVGPYSVRAGTSGVPPAEVHGELDLPRPKSKLLLQAGARLQAVPDLKAVAPPGTGLRAKVWIPGLAGAVVAGIGVGVLLHGNSVVSAVENSQSGVAIGISSKSQLNQTLANAHTEQVIGVAGLSVGAAALALAGGLGLFGTAQ